MSKLDDLLTEADGCTKDHPLDEWDTVPVHKDIEAARAELAAMREELADWRDSAKRAAGEDCAPDEKHCTCVGPMRVTIAAMREVIAAADRVAAVAQSLGWVLVNIHDKYTATMDELNKATDAIAAYGAARKSLKP